MADAGRDDQRQFVSTLVVRSAQNQAEHDAGILIDRDGRHAGLDHLFGPIQELGYVNPHDRRRNQSEVGENGVATADRRGAEEDTAEAFALGDPVNLRSVVRDRDEVIPRCPLAEAPSYALEKIVLEDVGLERVAGLARNDEERPFEIYPAFNGPDLHRIRGIEDVQLRKTRDPAESLPA